MVELFWGWCVEGRIFGWGLCARRNLLEWVIREGIIPITEFSTNGILRGSGDEA